MASMKSLMSTANFQQQLVKWEVAGNISCRQKDVLSGNVFTSKSLMSTPLLPLRKALRPRGRFPCVAQSAYNELDNKVYSGTYGPWKVEESDKIEVISYRAGLVTAAISLTIAASAAYLPSDFPVTEAIISNLDSLYFTGCAGLGVALLLIHIYVTPIKRFLQLLWGVGVFGSVMMSVNFANPANSGLVSFVLDHPAGIWAVGPVFAALTGLVFKEGMCYGKLEAGILFFVIPATLLAHLSGIASTDTEKTLLFVWTVLFAVFGARKFQQPIKDDIGDKSVFVFQSLPREKQDEILRRMQFPLGEDRSDSE